MIKSVQYIKIFSKHHKKKLLLATLFFLTVWLVVFAYHLKQTITHLKSLNFTQAAQHASRGRKIITPLSVITLHLSPDIESVKFSLEAVEQGSQLANSLQPLLTDSLVPKGEKQNLDKNTAVRDIAKLKQILKKLEANLDRSLLAKKLSAKYMLQAAQDHLSALETLLTHNHSFIVLFQNTHELRASGGFIGSYARVDLSKSQLQNITIQDIYEPDGQFTGFIPAPPGIKEYLSSGKGWRLPDANWHPDFPMSAKKVLDFFSLAAENQPEPYDNLTGVIALNLPVVEQLLDITGEIFLPDYQLTVSKDNFANLARADREAFFPGSTAKPDFLQTVFTQLKIKLAELSPEQQQEVASLLLGSLQKKDVQLFSVDQELQAYFERYCVAGSITCQSPNHELAFIYLLESNVGINKANKKAQRQVSLDFTNQETAIQVKFANNSKNHYVNYQRLVIPEYSIIKSITYNDQPIKTWDEEMILNSHGELLKQVGFLLTVPEQEQGTLLIKLQTLQKTDQILIIKQPGLPPTPYTVRSGSKVETFVLEGDKIIQL